MPRYPSAHKDATRRRILDTAGRRFKQDGLDGSGIATLMRDAGVTNGAFYAHFHSKEDLIAAVITDQLKTQAQAISDAVGSGATLATYIRGYLSIDHVRDAAGGCSRDSGVFEQLARHRPHDHREGDLARGRSRSRRR